MKKIFPFLIFSLAISNFLFAQDASIRIVQTSYSSVDPDGGGPAKGSVNIQFEIMASAGTLVADGMGLSFVFQSSLLMATPTNTTIPLGPVAAQGANWTQNVDNRSGTTVSVSYGGRTFDRRMIIAFASNGGVPNVNITTSWTSVAQVTYWTLGTTLPEGGYATPEAGSIIPQNTLSTEGGFVEYPFLSPNMNSPLSVGSGVVPVSFSKFNAQCTGSGALISWSTENEINSSYYEIEKSTNGTDWKAVAKVIAAGQSSSARNYQQIDLGSAGNAFYRIKQVDIDGKIAYTDIARTNCDSKLITTLIYPVPANDKLNVVIKSDRSLKTQLIILDGIGQVIRKLDATIVSGNNNFSFNLSNLSTGHYTIRSLDASVNLNKPFTITR